MDQQAGRLSSCDHPSRTEKKIFNEDSLRYLWGNIKYINIGYIVVPVGENRDTGVEDLMWRQ